MGAYVRQFNLSLRSLTTAVAGITCDANDNRYSSDAAAFPWEEVQYFTLVVPLIQHLDSGVFNTAMLVIRKAQD